MMIRIILNKNSLNQKKQSKKKKKKENPCQNNKPLTNEQLKAKAPSLFQDQPYHEVSSKYYFIPTIEIIEQLRAENWYPVSVNQSG